MENSIADRRLMMRRSDFQSGGRPGPTKKGTFLIKKGTYKGKSQSENMQFVRHWYIPLHCGYINWDAFNIYFSLYIIQDIV